MLKRNWWILDVGLFLGLVIILLLAVGVVSVRL
jgi:hypothetical protein